MNTYGVVMAGGGGTRFWPLSRQNIPKQLLNLTGNDLMVNEAVDRLMQVAGDGNVFIVTNVRQVPAMLEAIKDRVQPNHILAEPAARNTAACIGYAAMEIVKKYGDGIMVITPSDHFIKNNSEFTKVLKLAVKTAEDTDKLVTIGITPTYPATGFGYIKFDDTPTLTKPVIEFREKPDKETAKKYIDSGIYVWNSGMFVWKASVILDKFKKYIPDIYDDLNKIGEKMGTPEEKVTLETIYPNIRNISVDYAIMEPSSAEGDILVIPGDFGWDDVGSLDMMDILHQPDKLGNVEVGDTLAIDTTNTVLYSSKKIVTAVGVDNLIIVDTPDAIMVCSKDRAQDVKKIVEALAENDRIELL